MEIDARITFLFDSHGKGAQIEISDNTSSICFFRGSFNAEQVCMLMGRLSHCEMESAEVHGLDRVGKKLEWKTLEFEMPSGNHGYGGSRKLVACEEARRICPEGWLADCHFGSQNSFFKDGDKNCARTTIRRWVDVPKDEKG